MNKEKPKSKLNTAEQARLKELEKKHGQVNLERAYQKLAEARKALTTAKESLTKGTFAPPALIEAVDEWNRHVFLLTKAGPYSA